MSPIPIPTSEWPCPFENDVSLPDRMTLAPVSALIINFAEDDVPRDADGIMNPPYRPLSTCISMS